METLEHRDVPSATITIAPGSDATEGGASGSFIITRTGDTTTAITVNITPSGTADPLAEYPGAVPILFGVGDITETCTLSPNIKYADSAIIAVDISRPSTIPHEIGHLLMDSANHAQGVLGRTRLMYGVSGQDQDTVFRRQRLVGSEQALMLGDPSSTPPTTPKRPNLLTGP